MDVSFKDFLPQVLLIVFSVVLGLTLTKRIEKIQERKKANKLVSHLKEEIAWNRNEVLEWMPYHQDLKKAIDSVSKEDAFIQAFEENPLVLHSLAPSGLFNGSINTAAWETAKLSNSMSDIPYPILKDISKVYHQLGITFEPISDMGDMLMRADINAKGKSHGNLFTMSRQLRELVGREYRFLIYCNRVLGDRNGTEGEVIDSLVNLKMEEKRRRAEQKEKEKENG